MAKKKILVVEDEEDILELEMYNLAREGYQVAGVHTGEEALTAVRNSSPDLIVLDLMLPGMDGMEVCRRLKSSPHTRQVPLIMLTAKSEESDVVSGLELGADDYITKPFSPKVFLARVRAALRQRAKQEEDERTVVQVHDLMVNPDRHEVIVEGARIDLTSTEFKILHFLARRPGWVFSRKQIVEAVHGMNYPATDRSVDFQIVGLRKKLGQAGSYIETVRGVGYRFKE